jgi:hypothetical protein
MRVRNHHLHAGEPAPLEPVQELDPEDLGRRDADGHAEHFHGGRPC